MSHTGQRVESKSSLFIECPIRTDCDNESRKLQELGTLAEGIAHDFNNILLTISGNAKLAVQQLPPEHPTHSNLLEITKAAGRATELIKKILNFSPHQEVRTQPVHPQTVDEEEPSLLRGTLPAAMDESPPVLPASVPTPQGDGQHILYVDDEEMLVLLITRTLKRLGYRVTGFTDPVEALGALRRSASDFDAIITDLSMPQMSGTDFARQALQVCPKLPVILTSGYIRPQDQELASDIGVRELILKPNTIEDLGCVLHRLLRAPESEAG